MNIPYSGLYIPLWCRARCLLEYPQLGVGEADALILRSLRGDFSAARRADCLLYALREKLLSEGARRHLAALPDAALIDLGCGLDTLLRRLGGRETRRFYVDLPEVMELRERLIPRADGETYICADVRRAGFLDGIDAPGGAIFLIGGLLCHLEYEAAAALLKNIGLRFPGARLVFDGMGFAPRRTGLASSLPSPAALAGECGFETLETMKRLPEVFALVPASRRLKLRFLLGSGLLRFYSGRMPE